ncbi:MAG: hypothetical protein WAL59_25235 [Roseiarcus sp.]
MRRREVESGIARLPAEIVQSFEGRLDEVVPDIFSMMCPIEACSALARRFDNYILSTAPSEKNASEFVNVVIETRGEYTIGRTVVDHEKRTKRAPNCHVAFAAERDKFSLS